MTTNSEQLFQKLTNTARQHLDENENTEPLDVVMAVASFHAWAMMLVERDIGPAYAAQRAGTIRAALPKDGINDQRP